MRLTEPTQVLGCPLPPLPVYIPGLIFIFALLVLCALVWVEGVLNALRYGMTALLPPASPSIRDLLLAGETGFPADLLPNLVPKRE